MVFLNPRFLGMENHLGPLPEASDGPEGQEQPVRAVGGQGEHYRIIQLKSRVLPYNSLFFTQVVQTGHVYPRWGP